MLGYLVRMKIPSPYQNYPPRWPTFDERIPSHRAVDFGFAGTVADINRFAARYRATRCFRRVEFVVFTHQTSDGYNGLCQLLLTYSAFEYLLRALKLDQHRASAFLSASERDTILKHVHTLDSGDALFSVIRPHVNRPHQKQFALYRQTLQPVLLGIRHSSPVRSWGADAESGRWYDSISWKREPLPHARSPQSHGPRI